MSKKQLKKGNKKEKEKEGKERGSLHVPRKLKALWDKSVLSLFLASWMQINYFAVKKLIN